VIKGFWEKLAKPIVGMSPMDGVTDASWRFIAKKYGQPDVVFTEFVSAEGLWRIKKRQDMENKIWKDLKYDETERPVVAQIFGSDPESFYESAKIICDLGFDGIDINMGCPSPGLEKRGGGAGLIRVPDLARQVIEATRRGVKDWVKEGNKEDFDGFPIRSGMTDRDGLPREYTRNDDRVEIPVSVKTRIGSSEPDREWWKFLASMELPAVTIHGRTFKQLYSGLADWELLAEAAKIIRSKDTLFLANGDVSGVRVNQTSNENEDLYRFPIRSGMTNGDEDGGMTIKLTNGTEILTNDFDGVLIGRAAMGNPWIFRKDGYQPTLKEKLTVAIEHAEKYEEIFKDKNEYEELDGFPIKSGMTSGVIHGGGGLPHEYIRNDEQSEFRFFSMRKHLAWYAHGFEDAAILRRDLVMSNSAEEVKKIVGKYLLQGESSQDSSLDAV
jgi:tRNA-dihydrouridine synthase